MSVNPRRRDLYRDAARAKGLDFESVLRQFVGDVGEDGLLRRREFDHQRQQQALAFDFLRRSLLQDLLEQHALVGHVLVDDPQAFRIHREDEGVANLAQRFERGQRRSQIARGFCFVGNGRSATVVSNRVRHRLWGANQGQSGVAVDRNAFSELEALADWRCDWCLQAERLRLGDARTKARPRPRPKALFLLSATGWHWDGR